MQVNAGDTMNGDVVMREQLSALVDGELVGAQCAQVVAFTDSEGGRAAWHEYHLIGDVLRSTELARPLSCDLVSRLRAQLQEEAKPASLARGETVQVAPPPRQEAEHPAVAAGRVASLPVAAPQRDEAANSEVFRWKMVAGLASLAAVATIGWNAYSGLTASQPGMQLAAAPAVTNQPSSQVAVNLPVQNGAPVMIRDPRLDELLAAHKQYGSTSALQMPAGFLRNATFEAPAR